MQVLITLQYEFILLRIFPKTLDSATPVIWDGRQVQDNRGWKNKMVKFVVVDLQLWEESVLIHLFFFSLASTS